ncbi:hypothetical protein COCVIDRAFT_99515, partial [Bipolaris victoriae FI3]
ALIIASWTGMDTDPTARERDALDDQRLIHSYSTQGRPCHEPCLRVLENRSFVMC